MKKEEKEHGVRYLTKLLFPVLAVVNTLLGLAALFIEVQWIGRLANAVSPKFLAFLTASHEKLVLVYDFLLGLISDNNGAILLLIACVVLGCILLARLEYCAVRLAYWVPVYLYKTIVKVTRKGAGTISKLRQKLREKSEEIDDRVVDADKLDSGLTDAARNMAHSRLEELRERTVRSKRNEQEVSYLRIQNLLQSGGELFPDQIRHWDETGRITLETMQDNAAVDIVFRLCEGQAHIVHSGAKEEPMKKGVPYVIKRKNHGGEAIPRYAITWFGGN